MLISRELPISNREKIKAYKSRDADLSSRIFGMLFILRMLKYTDWQILLTCASMVKFSSKNTPRLRTVDVEVMHSDAFRTNSYRAIANHSLLLVVLLIITFPQLRSLALEMPSIQYIPFSHPLTYHVWSRDRVASTSGIQPSAVYPFWNTSCTCPARC